MGFKSIAIDGPAGAGKSTLARQVAAALGYLYVDTGAIYRTLGLAALRRGVDPQDGAAVVALLEDCAIDLRHGGDGMQRMYLNGEDVSQAIRLPEVSRYASGVSAIPEVRAHLMDMQRDLARRNDVVMDGRDIGTVVLPAADVKVFLTASPEERARRRWEELQQRGTPEAYEEVLKDLVERDAKDSGRAAAPLRRAEDAVEVDTTGCSLEESLERLLSVIRAGVLA
ncbi:cytidylate kinase [Flavonifractor sp. An92]|uniref:(d)CMP kinase n=1 Tax=Flavonifractor sp. An92 TaxID=1965666 RepID=UPI000B37AF99|nr:(d)CMP kinase [Flavonifractor sp. An92]OUN07953.1 cytidylate kinase [Flavonifractor sp. An92]